MKIFNLAVALIVVISSVTTDGALEYMCDFESDACGWSDSDWQRSIPFQPDTTSYPGFSWASTYMWLQNKESSMESPEFTVTDNNTYFRYDYYFNPLINANGNYLHLFFVVNTFPAKKILLDAVTISFDGWLSANISCSDSKVDFCCGARDAFPCTGKIQIIGALQAVPPYALFAVDNIVAESISPVTDTTTSSTTSSLTTLTTPTTLSTLTTPTPLSTSTTPTISPTPTTQTPLSTSTTPTILSTSTTSSATTEIPNEIQCCPFEEDTCIWTPTNWFWSNNVKPLPPPPYHPGGEYMWAVANGATLESITLHVPAESTVFTLVYYLFGETGLDQVLVSFTEINSTEENVQATLTNTNNEWLLVTTDCSPKTLSTSSGCCKTYPCDVKVKIMATAVSASFLVAIDDTGIDGDCGNSYPCCQFEDTFTCGFSNNPPTNSAWHSSQLAKPDYDMIPYFTDTSGYVWFQTTDGSSTGTFRSPLLNISSTEEITSIIYAYTDQEQIENRLEIIFHNADSDAETLLDYAITTSDSWLSFVVSCSSAHGNCCGEKSSCSGYLDFVPNVAGGKAFYAVDSSYFKSCSLP